MFQGSSMVSNGGSNVESIALQRLIFEETIEEEVKKLDNELEQAMARLFYLEGWGISDIANLFSSPKEAVAAFLTENVQFNLSSLPEAI